MLARASLTLGIGLKHLSLPRYSTLSFSLPTPPPRRSNNPTLPRSRQRSCSPPLLTTRSRLNHRRFGSSVAALKEQEVEEHVEYGVGGYVDVGDRASGRSGGLELSEQGSRGPSTILPTKQEGDEGKELGGMVAQEDRKVGDEAVRGKEEEPPPPIVGSSSTTPQPSGQYPISSEPPVILPTETPVDVGVATVSDAVSPGNATPALSAATTIPTTPLTQPDLPDNPPPHLPSLEDPTSSSQPIPPQTSEGVPEPKPKFKHPNPPKLTATSLPLILRLPFPTEVHTLRPILSMISVTRHIRLIEMKRVREAQALVRHCHRLWLAQAETAPIKGEARHSRWLGSRPFRKSLFEAAISSDLPDLAWEVSRSLEQNIPRGSLAGLVGALTQIRAWPLIIHLTNTFILSSPDTHVSEPSATPSQTKGALSHLQTLYTARMIAFCQTDQPVLAIQAFDCFHRAGIPASRIAYVKLFQAHLMNHDLASANQTLTVLVENKWTADDEFLLSLTTGYRALGFDQEMEAKVLQDMQDKVVPWSIMIVNTLMQLRADANDAKGAVGLLRFVRFPKPAEPEPKDKAFLPVADKATFTILINLAGREGGMSTVEELWTRMMKLPNNRIDAPAVGALMRGYVRCGRVLEAVEVLEKAIRGEGTNWIPRNHLPGLKLHPSCFNVVLSGMSATTGLEGAMRVLALMKSARVRPDVTSVRWMVESLGRWTNASATDMAVACKGLMTECEGLQPDPRMLDMLLAEEAKQLEYAAAQESTRPNPIRIDPDPELFDPTAGVQPSTELSTSFPEVFIQPEILLSKSSSVAFSTRLQVESKLPPKARVPSFLDSRSIYNLILERGIKPTASHFLQIMQRFVNQGEMERAHDLLDFAAKVGVPANAAMWVVLAWGYAQEERWSACHQILDNATEGGKNVNLWVATSVAAALIRTERYHQADQLIERHLRVEPMDLPALHVSFTAKMRSLQYTEATSLLEQSMALPWDKPLRDNIKRFITFHQKLATSVSTLLAEQLRTLLQTNRDRHPPPKALNEAVVDLREVLRGFQWDRYGPVKSVVPEKSKEIKQGKVATKEKEV